MAQRRSDAVDLVRCDLFSLPRSAEDDRAVRLTVDDRPCGGGAERGVVNGLGGIRPDVDDRVALLLEEGLEVLLQRVPGVVTADRDPHPTPLTRSARAASLAATFPPEGTER